MMNFSKDQLDDAKTAVQIPWQRFCNGLKIDGKQKSHIMKYVYSLQEYIQRLEQRIWNLENTLNNVTLLKTILRELEEKHDNDKS